MTTDTQHRGRAGWIVAVVLVIALLGGIALFFGIDRLGPHEDVSSASAVSSLEDRTASTDTTDLVGAGFRELPTPADTIPEAPATDAAAAVVGFLSAEANADYEASYEFLAMEDQRLYGSAAGWVAAHASVLPPVTGFEIGEPTEDGGTVQVASVVGFVPSLDEVVGLVPARAEITWSVQSEDGRFGVSLQNSSFAPVFLEDDSAADAARAWVASRQSCRNEGEWGGTLLGVQGLAQTLCDTTGDPEVGEPGPLPQLEATPFVGAFGEDALSWSRVVAVETPVEMRVVLAPIGAQWRVIGVLPPGAIGVPD